MGLIEWAANKMGYSRTQHSPEAGWHDLSWEHRYGLRRAYYRNNDLYDQVNRILRDSMPKKVLALRNPAHRSVEFFATHLWPGNLPEALPVKAANEAIVPAIEQVWSWSNWAAKKQLAARWMPMYGDLFIRVGTRGDRFEEGLENVRRVYLDLIEPPYVTEFDVDERGYVEFIRLDIPKTRRVDDELEGYVHTEVWSKERGDYRLWEHDGHEDDLDRLGPSTVERGLAEFGIDFVPFVWAPFTDAGEERGASCFDHALEKIDEGNLRVTHFHRMLYRDSTWAIGGQGNDASGRPMPAPQVEAGTVEYGGETMVTLPGTAQLQSLVPNLNFGAMLNVIDAHMTELAEDLPELLYYQNRDREESGRALMIKLAGAVDRAKEARGNAEVALSRADQMALTIGQNANLPGFQNLGDFESGDFEHTFDERAVLPTTEGEDVEVLRAEAELYKALAELSPSMLRLQLRKEGYTDADIETIVTEAEQVNSQPSDLERLINE